MIDLTHILHQMLKQLSAFTWTWERHTKALTYAPCGGIEWIVNNDYDNIVMLM